MSGVSEQWRAVEAGQPGTFPDLGSRAPMDSITSPGVFGPFPAGEALRPYQAELLDLAKKGNTIIYLETGLGKTLIAIHLMRHYVQKLRLRQRAYELDLAAFRAQAQLASAQGRILSLEQGDAGMRSSDALRIALPKAPPRKWVIFVVPRVLLCRQQQLYTLQQSDIRCGQLVGEMLPDAWTPEKFSAYLCEYDMLCVTGGVLRNMLVRGNIHMHEIALLVIDECHQSRGKHDYVGILDFYRRLKQSINTGEAPAEHRLPRILGLTASPVNVAVGSSHRWRQIVEDQLRELQHILDARIATVNYVPAPPALIEFKHLSSIDQLAGHKQAAANEPTISLDGTELKSTEDFFKRRCDDVIVEYRTSALYHVSQPDAAASAAGWGAPELQSAWGHDADAVGRSAGWPQSPRESPRQTDGATVSKVSDIIHPDQLRDLRGEAGLSSDVINALVGRLATQSGIMQGLAGSAADPFSFAALDPSPDSGLRLLDNLVSERSDRNRQFARLLDMVAEHDLLRIREGSLAAGQVSRILVFVERKLHCFLLFKLFKQSRLFAKSRGLYKAAFLYGHNEMQVRHYVPIGSEASLHVPAVSQVFLPLTHSLLSQILSLILFRSTGRLQAGVPCSPQLGRGRPSLGGSRQSRRRARRKARRGYADRLHCALCAGSGRHPPHVPGVFARPPLRGRGG